MDREGNGCQWYIIKTASIDLSVPFEERRRQDVALVEDKANSLALHPNSPHDSSKVLVEMLQRVAVARLYLLRKNILLSMIIGMFRSKATIKRHRLKPELDNQ